MMKISTVSVLLALVMMIVIVTTRQPRQSECSAPSSHVHQSVNALQVCYIALLLQISYKVSETTLCLVALYACTYTICRDNTLHGMILHDTILSGGLVKHDTT